MIDCDDSDDSDDDFTMNLLTLSTQLVNKYNSSDGTTTISLRESLSILL